MQMQKFFPTEMICITWSKYSCCVFSSMSGKAACTNEFGPKIRVVKSLKPSLISFR